MANLIDKETLAKLQDCDPASTICVLPLGATEQHGPHLPFCTDSVIARGVCDALERNYGDKFQLAILPVEETGYSPEHLDYAGSRSLSWEEAISRWVSIGKSLAEKGFRKLVLMNAHGGNSPLMNIVATQLRVECSMLCVATAWTRFGWPEGLISEEEQRYGIHGGDIETSVMLHLAPELVDMAKSENFSSTQAMMEKDNTYLRAYGRHAFGWKMQDLNSMGVAGEASIASASKGEKLLLHSVDGLAKLIDDVQRFDTKKLDEADQLALR